MGSSGDAVDDSRVLGRRGREEYQERREIGKLGPSDA